MIVMIRSERLGMLRAIITLGTAQAMPPIKGITDLPLKPNGRTMRSIKKTTRDM